MRILILSDSLALPRIAPQELKYDDTYPVMLKNQGHEVHQVSIGGATSGDLVKQISYHKHFQPELVIVQVGIVDCAPRHATKAETRVLKKIPYAGRAVLRLLNRPSVRKIRKLRYTKPQSFEKNIKSVKDLLNQSGVLFIGIMPASKAYEHILPGITKSIREYNAIIEKTATDSFVDVSDFPPEALMSDHHHLNKTGHSMLYKALLQEIEKRRKSQD